MDKKIAFFVDGGYFVKRVRYFLRKYFNAASLEPQHVIEILYWLVSKHQSEERLNREELYRIFYYDSPPFEKQLREPVARNGNRTPATRNFKRDSATLFQQSLHNQLKAKRKLALHMGKLSNHQSWALNDDVLPKLLRRDISVDDLTPDHFHVDVKQKGVDTRIGIDITSVTLNKFVDTMVLIASDADFVPAAKLARTHGVDVILDPLYGNVDEDLSLHIDGKRSFDMVAMLASIIGLDPEPRPSWWEGPSSNP